MKSIFKVVKRQGPTSFPILARSMAVLTESVPALGESITEGALAEWMKNVGESVEVDDVIATVETDKVTVDIKSPYSGTLVEQLANVDDTIVVGAPLFKIDTEAEGVPSAPTPAPAQEAPSSSSQPIAAAMDNDSPRKRTPLIKFLGKRSLLKNTAPTPAAAPMKTGPSIVKKPVKDGNGVDFRTLVGGAWFGRPELSESEIEAIESGGASLLEM